MLTQNNLDIGNMHADFKRVLGLFLKRYGESIGTNKFLAFITGNKLDVSKQYHPSTQFTESFSWVEPLISKYKQDNQAKYYLVRALTANVSMKNTDWSDYSKMQKAAETLSWRPVNLNHDHSTWFSYPRTRVDFTKADDFSVEATLRVDNQDKQLQDMLDSGKIMHPSIEARANLDGGYQFTAMALVVAGEDLPGDPLTEIVPLMFNESMAEEVCKLVNGELVCECEKTEVKENMSTTTKNEAISDHKKVQFMTDCLNSGKSQTECEVLCEKQLGSAPASNQEAVMATTCPQCKTALDATGMCPNKNCQMNKTQLPADVNETLATKDRQIAELTEYKADAQKEIEALKEAISKEKATVKNRDGRLRQLEESVRDRDKRIDQFEKDTDLFREDIGKLTQARETAISEKNEALGKAAKDAERANQEITARASIQRECGDLRESYAKVTREYADLTLKRSDDAKTISGLQTESIGYKTDLQQKTEALEAKAKECERVDFLLKKARKIFDKEGIREVNHEGNLVSPV